MPKLLLYCTKAKPYLYYAQESRTLMEIDNSFEGYKTTNKNVDDTLNGKIVAECDFEVEEIDCLINTFTGEIIDYSGHTELRDIDLFKRSCLDLESLKKYLGKKGGYAIHIKNLHIFDKPKNLQLYSSMREEYRATEKAPQNMMYAFDEKEKQYILISIRPEWLCKILNGDKTIEVRKKVLKEMLK